MRRSTYQPSRVGTRFVVKWNAVGNLAAVILLALCLLTWAALTALDAYPEPAAATSPDTVSVAEVAAESAAEMPLVVVSQLGTDSAEPVDGAPLPDAWHALPPCPTEDSIGCYWDASEHGSGDGLSYVTDHDGNTFYVDGSILWAIKYPLAGSVADPTPAP